jgi:hypothetical protein
MRARSFVATVAGIAALLVGARSSVAGEGPAPSTAEGASLRNDIQRVRRAGLLLVSVGLSRLRLWTEAAAVSRELLAEADDPFDACIAQAAIVWQTSGAFVRGGTSAEWEKLRRMVSEIESTAGASNSDVEMCRAVYRRVTGHLIYMDSAAFHCGSNSMLKRQRKRLRGLYEAYWAVEPGLAASRSLLRRSNITP